MAIRPRPLDVEAGTRDAFGDAEARECPMISEGSASEGHGVRACDRRFGEGRRLARDGERGSSVKSPEGNRIANCLPVRKISVYRFKTGGGVMTPPLQSGDSCASRFVETRLENHSTQAEPKRRKRTLEIARQFVSSRLRFAVRAPSRTSRVAPRERHDAGLRRVRRHRARARPRPRIWARRSRPHAGPSRPEVRPRRRRAPGETLSSSRCARLPSLRPPPADERSRRFPPDSSQADARRVPPSRRPRGSRGGAHGGQPRT